MEESTSKNPYFEYLNSNHENTSETDSMAIIDKLFSIKIPDYNEKYHFTIINVLTRIAYDKKFISVINELKKIYPLSTNEYEKVIGWEKKVIVVKSGLN